MIYKINGTSVPSNSRTQVVIQDLDKSDGTGRTEDGTAFRDCLRRGVRTINFEFTMLKQSQLKTILDLMDSDFFEVEYLDPRDGQTTRTFYVSDRNTELLHNLGSETYWSLSGSFVEQ